MTQEQFNEALRLSKEIKFLRDKNEQLGKIVNLLKENVNKGYNRPDIRIEINDTWTPIKGTIDCHELINFLIQQKVKNETKIEKMQEEFEKI